MLYGCRVAAMLPPLLLLLLLAAETGAQSGDGDSEPRISCSSHILTTGSSLSCQLVLGRHGDDDDEDDDGVEKMAVCYTDYSKGKRMCLEVFGDTITDLNPVVHFNVTVYMKRGGWISTTDLDLTQIVKPWSPQVENVNVQPDQVVIRVQTPYHKEYLTVDNQLFQLLIWTAGSTMTQNISSDVLQIYMEHLREHAEYHVRVRALPVQGMKGSWSDWSDTVTFFTPAEEKVREHRDTDERWEMYTLIVCLAFLVVVVVPSSVVFLWKNKIFRYMWPSIPHPKHTLVHICKPNKGLLLNLHPEVFSSLKVDQTEKQPCEETDPSAGAEPDPSCSTQTSDCSRSTTSTEELELSTLLSRSSADGGDSLQSTSPSPMEVPGLGERPLTPQPECSSSAGNEAEAYVTMSSFYQVK